MFRNADTNRYFAGSGTTLVLNATTVAAKSFQSNGSFSGFKKGVRFGAVLWLNITTAISGSGGAVIFNLNGVEVEVAIPAGLEVGQYKHEIEGICTTGSVVWFAPSNGGKGASSTYTVNSSPPFDFKVRLPAGTGAGTAAFVSTWVA
jgi:hypothetical protein